MGKHIIIVEDETAIRENYTDVLQQQGYRVTGMADKSTALLSFAKQLPDLVILDISLADEIDAGFELCQVLRQRSASLPIIFLTARDSDIDAVSGLRLGADDYLTKNISLPHLMARISALFRRTQLLATPTSPQTTPEGPLQIDTDRLSVHWKTQLVELTLTEFWLIHSLARRPGHARTRDQLMQDANIYVDLATITTHIRRIRNKFIDIDPDFDAIEAIYGLGYRWKV